MASEYLKWKYRDVKPDEPPPPLTGKRKLKNWFRYNWGWLLAGAALFAVVLGVVLNALGVGKTKPDYIFAYVGRAELSPETQTALFTALEALGEDVNGDGKTVVELRPYVTTDNTADQNALGVNYAVGVRLAADITVGESVFFLTDDPQALQKEYQILAFPDGTLPAEDDTTWEGKALPVWTLPALDLSEDTGLYIGIRGFATDKRVTDKAADDALWGAILKGAIFS